MESQQRRERRKKHIRKHVNGTAVAPRVFVFKSNKHLFAGAADDEAGKVILGGMESKNSKGAKELGVAIAKKLKEAKIEKAVFDRSGYKYHGIMTAFVESLREKGIKI
ncbi:50S ribosomal protein L18 [Candidatus Dojkabacteria bacterium]|jgi:large subunit ribosomal protein L18|nr:50S ribosomal protein L18 [Candidatus Dojkabacteria bacterium]